MIVSEGGKLYNIDDETGLVTEASIDESPDSVSREELDAEFRIGDRVDVDGDTGTIIAITASMYGPAFGIRFDDNTIDEYPESKLASTTAEAVEFDGPITEVLARFANYQVLPALTEDEMNRKEAEARWLNTHAKAHVTDNKLSLSDQNDLNHIVLATATDLYDLKDLRVNLASNQEYLKQFNRYKIADEFVGGGDSMGHKGDMSWIESVDAPEVVDTTDEELAARAAEMVTTLSAEQLADDEFMAIAASYQNEYLQNGTDRADKFARFLSLARTDRLAELKGRKVEAKTDDGLDDINDAALFL